MRINRARSCSAQFQLLSIRRLLPQPARILHHPVECTTTAFDPYVIGLVVAVAPDSFTKLRELTSANTGCWGTQGLCYTPM